MICTKCQFKDTRVLDSRETDGHRAVRRRRECLKCRFRFTTFERIETTKFIVVKKDGSRENYDREKVEKGIWTACQKRKVTDEQVTDAIAALEEKWAAAGKEVPSDMIGEGIMDVLREIDEVAYIRFASVYRQFKDLASFKKELKKMEE
jgi:transcriptional repressor NrdR